MKKTVAILLGGIILSYQNCAYVSRPQESTRTQSSVEAGTESEVLTKSAMGLLRTKCAACHSPENPQGHFESVEDLEAMLFYRYIVPGEASISPLYEVISRGEMPPNPADRLNSEQVKIVFEWINSGLKEDGEGGGVPLDPAAGVLMPTYSSIQANVLRPKCSGCHNATRQDGGVNLSTYTAVMNTVTPGNPATSSLFTTTQSGDMPRRGTRLTAAQLGAIRDWITQNAQNN